MIYLHSGTPGSGKTLFTLWHVKQRAEKEGRPVFYNGIPDLNIPDWTEFSDINKWFELPHGAIIIIDECQREFRPRGSGKAVPESISKMETHRHGGYDLYLISQHPMLIDQNIRRLCGTHRHVVRSFGFKHAVVHEWYEVRTDCDQRRIDSSKTAFPYPKEAFKWYKSAEVHTHKIAPPRQVFYIIFAVLLLSYLLFSLYTRYVGATRPVIPQEEKTQKNDNGTSPAFPSIAPSKTATLSLEQWLDQYKPRVKGLPHTAPRYDEFTKPVRVAYPAGCVAIKDRCQCYTQDATKMDVGDGMCRNIVARGYWVDFEPDQRKVAGEGGRQAGGEVRSNAQPTDARPVPALARVQY